MATVSDGNLDRKVTDRDIDKLAGFVVSWEDMAGPLGLDRAKKREIEHIKTYREQKKECVEEWREQGGEKATYRAFIEAAREAELNGLADKVMAMLWERETPIEGIEVNIISMPLHIHM